MNFITIKNTFSDKILIFRVLKELLGTSLTVQWLGLHASNAGGTGLIPDPGTKIPTCCLVQPKKNFLSKNK